ncbi:MAG: hypothetical protein KJO03_09875 [Gammaproteobacteria bacterium]|nr:hypothetical protein [Gammaproteobacteria bacterium]
MKSKWPGINAKDTVLIDLPYESFHLSEDPVVIDGIYFTAKEELHVTLVGEKVGTILQNKIRQNSTSSEVLEHAFDDIDWSFNRSGPIHILSRFNKKRILQKSVIMLIDMPGVTKFYQRLKSLGLISGKTPVPPAHVTLYTYNCSLGIGVPSNKVLASLSDKSFSVEEFSELLNNSGSRN